MIRHISIFSACFILGALATLAIRTARHDPHAPVGTELQAGTEPQAGAEPQATAIKPAATAAIPEMPGAAPTSASTAVNTVCALCGMTVDPKIPTALYQGKVIGFGCKACPPKFAADPERYGPSALANQVVE